MKNSIITGARSGIGYATLRTFSQHGINTWALVHRITPEFQNDIELLQKENGVWIIPILVEMDKPESIKNAFSKIKKQKKNIDILVNSAGVVSPNRLFTMTKMSDIRHLFEVNFFGLIELTQLVARTMILQKEGSIINISSIAAWGEDTSQLEYAASKSAIITLTKKLARELGPLGIRVNSIAPGLTETNMSKELDDASKTRYLEGHPEGRFAKSEEIAEVIFFLASSHSRFINGETIKVDGGGYDLRKALSKR